MSNKQRIQELVSARDLLASKKFAKGAYGKKANGHTPCKVTDTACTCVCMEGAMAFAEGYEPTYAMFDGEVVDMSENEELLLKSIKFLYPSFSGDSVNAFNDLPDTTKEKALKVFDFAIHSLKFGA